MVRLGMEVKYLGETRVPRLESANATSVCLVPAPVFEGGSWPRVRVEMARAGRFFLVQTVRAESAPVVAAMRDGAFDVVSDGDTD